MVPEPRSKVTQWRELVLVDRCRSYVLGNFVSWFYPVPSASAINPSFFDLRFRNGVVLVSPKPISKATQWRGIALVGTLARLRCRN